MIYSPSFGRERMVRIIPDLSDDIKMDATASLI